MNTLEDESEHKMDFLPQNNKVKHDHCHLNHHHHNHHHHHGISLPEIAFECLLWNWTKK